MLAYYAHVKDALFGRGGRCSPSVVLFFLDSPFRLRGKQGEHRHITMNVWIPAELRGGALEHSTLLSWLQPAKSTLLLIVTNTRLTSLGLDFIFIV